MSIDVSQFHQVFFEESFEGLDTMEMGLLALSDGAPCNEVINTIFRAAHSIKGGAGTFGFMAVSDFTHHLETLLDEIRNGQRDITQATRAVCLEAVDVLREMLKAVQASVDIDETRVQEVSARLQVLLGAPTGPRLTAEVAAEKSASSNCGWKITFIPNPDMLQTGNDPVRLLQELGELGDIRVSMNDDRLPAFIDLVPEECYLHWDIELLGDVDKAAITEIFEWVEDDCELSIEPLPAPQASDKQVQTADKQTTNKGSPEVYGSPAAGVVERQEQANAAPSQAMAVVTGNESGSLSTAHKTPAAEPGMSSIRVGTEKVDSLINLVGELVITQSMLSQMGENFEPGLLPGLLDGLEQLERNTRELQEGIMRIRMIPISFVFNRMPRLVHDLSTKLGKKIELKLTGEQTELDKTVMEKVGDPLVHLVRNSLDHGLETPEKRLLAGKTETGLLHIEAYHQGGNIVIEIEDDGAGLNEQKILSKAVERGMVSDTDALTLSPERIHELIFMPGFSTAEVVNDISGRGVGMDVVKKNIHSLGGTIEVKSEPGKGSRFTIRLPLTLAIMDGQIIRIAEQKYIIPLISIIESVVIKANTVKKVAGKGELYKFRDEYIPLIRLHEVFDQQPDTREVEGELLVVVESEHNIAGLLVDDLLSQQQIVIKSLETHYRNVRGLSGATILGDGMVALILDVAGLMTMYRSAAIVDETRSRVV